MVGEGLFHGLGHGHAAHSGIKDTDHGIFVCRWVVYNPRDGYVRVILSDRHCTGSGESCKLFRIRSQGESPAYHTIANNACNHISGCGVREVAASRRGKIGWPSVHNVLISVQEAMLPTDWNSSHSRKSGQCPWEIRAKWPPDLLFD